MHNSRFLHLPIHRSAQLKTTFAIRTSEPCFSRNNHQAKPKLQILHLADLPAILNVFTMKLFVYLKNNTAISTRVFTNKQHGTNYAAPRVFLLQFYRFPFGRNTEHITNRAQPPLNTNILPVTADSRTRVLSMYVHKIRIKIIWFGILITSLINVYNGKH